MLDKTIAYGDVNRYKINEVTGCWEWLGSINEKGYAKLKVDSVVATAHVWFWEHFNGPVPKGLELHHMCNVRHCVNPEHLKPVTHTENIRQSRRSKYSIETARLIRQDRDDGMTYAQLSAKHKIPINSLHSIIHSVTWKE